MKSVLLLCCFSQGQRTLPRIVIKMYFPVTVAGQEGVALRSSHPSKPVWLMGGGVIRGWYGALIS